MLLTLGYVRNRKCALNRRDLWVEARVNKKEKRVSNCLTLFTEYQGHQTYICTAVVITPRHCLVLNICRCTLYSANCICTQVYWSLILSSLSYLLLVEGEARTTKVPGHSHRHCVQSCSEGQVFLTIA